MRVPIFTQVGKWVKTHYLQLSFEIQYGEKFALSLTTKSHVIMRNFLSNLQEFGKKNDYRKTLMGMNCYINVNMDPVLPVGGVHI